MLCSLHIYSVDGLIITASTEIHSSNKHSFAPVPTLYITALGPILDCCWTWRRFVVFVTKNSIHCPLLSFKSISCSVRCTVYTLIVHCVHKDGGGGQFCIWARVLSHLKLGAHYQTQSLHWNSKSCSTLSCDCQIIWFPVTVAFEWTEPVSIVPKQELTDT